MHQTEDVLANTLLQLIVIVLAARGASLWLRRGGQPGAVSEILAGLALGPSLLGALAPQLSQTLFRPQSAGTIQMLSQLGLILLMFQIGSDFHFAHLRQRPHRRAVLAVAGASVGAPLGLGLLLGWKSAPALAAGVDPLIYSLFCAVALAITAVPVLGRILRQFDLTQTPVGVIAISAAAINDMLGWILLAAVSALATARFSLQHLLLQFAGIAAFAALLWYGGRPLADALLRRLPLQKERVSANLMAAVIVLLFAAGVCTYELGIFAIFGGFAVGLLFHRHRPFVEAWQRQVGQFVLVFFLPVFFTCTGLRTNLLGLSSPSDWIWCGGFVLLGCLGKILPVYWAGRAAGMPRHDATVCGVLMNTRALMELVVLNIGLDLGFIPPKVFTMLVIMAVATTLMTAPLLGLAYRRSGRSLAAVVEA